MRECVLAPPTLTCLRTLETFDGPRKTRRLPPRGAPQDRGRQLRRRVAHQRNRPRHPAGPHPGGRERSARPRDHETAPAAGARREAAPRAEAPPAPRAQHLPGTPEEPREPPPAPPP